MFGSIEGGKIHIQSTYVKMKKLSIKSVDITSSCHATVTLGHLNIG